jgi:hypothetical protein
MAETSPIVTLLSQRSSEELDAMRSKAEESLSAVKAELTWIEKALATKKPKRTPRRPSKPGDTKKRVLKYIKNSVEPVSPAQVRDGINATGGEVGKSTIYNTFRRLLDDGEIVKVDEGLYKIAARNGHRAEEIGGSGSLLTATSPHEGQT